MILAADRSLSMCSRGCTANDRFGVAMGKLIYAAIASLDGVNRC